MIAYKNLKKITKITTKLERVLDLGGDKVFFLTPLITPIYS